jgi:hypothetical protein
LMILDWEFRIWDCEFGIGGSIRNLRLKVRNSYKTDLYRDLKGKTRARRLFSLTMTNAPA